MDIHLYRLEKCGYYKRGASEPEFGHITEWWDEFINWIYNKPHVAATATFTYSKRTITQVFCTSARRDAEGNLGVTLWNRLPDTEEGVGYISSDSHVDEVVPNEQPLPTENAIPGWPTYFWYMPEHGILVSLVPHNMRGFRSTGIPQAREYFRKYLEDHSVRHVDKRLAEESSTEVRYEKFGYRATPMHEGDFSTTPYFDTSLWTLPGLPADIRTNWTQIRKLVTETTLSTLQPSEISALDRILSIFGASTTGHPEDEKAKFRTAVDWTPTTIQELEQLIDDWKSREDKDNYSVGVQFTGGSKVHWLGRVEGKRMVDAPPNLSTKRFWKDEEVDSAWKQARPEVTALLESVGEQQESLS